MSRAARAALPAMLLGASAAFGDGGEGRTPELGLLEFLGEFEDAEGVWIDPVELERAGGPDASRSVTAKDEEEPER